MQDTACLGLVHGDDPQRCYGEGGGRGGSCLGMHVRIKDFKIKKIKKNLKKVFSTPQFKSIDSSVYSFLYSPTLTSIYDYWKNIALTRRTLVGKVVSLLFFFFNFYFYFILLYNTVLVLP